MSHLPVLAVLALLVTSAGTTRVPPTTYVTAGPHTIAYPTAFSAECPPPPGLYLPHFEVAIPEGTQLQVVDLSTDCRTRLWYGVAHGPFTLWVPSWTVRGQYVHGRAAPPLTQRSGACAAARGSNLALAPLRPCRSGLGAR